MTLRRRITRLAAALPTDTRVEIWFKRAHNTWESLDKSERVDLAELRKRRANRPDDMWIIEGASMLTNLQPRRPLAVAQEVNP